MTGELVTYLVRSLVDQAEEVQVREVAGEGLVRVEIRVAEGEKGKVIGRQGRIIQAIRVLARVAGAREGRRVQVEVVD